MLIIRLIFALVTISYSLFFIFKFIQPELYFHFQQPPFLLTTSFFYSYLSYPGGFSYYLADFLSHLFYFKFLGVLIVFALGLLIYLLTYYSIQVKARLFLAIIPVAMFFALLCNVYFPFSTVISFIITLSLILLTQKFSKNIALAFSLIIAGFLATYYLAGIGYTYVYAISSILILLSNKVLKKRFLAGIILVFIIPVLLYLMSNYIFLLSPSDKYWAFFRKVALFMTYTPVRFYYLFVFFPLILIAVDILAEWKKSHWTLIYLNKVKILPVASIFVAIFISVSLYFPYKWDLTKKRNFVLCDYYNEQGEWDKTIEIGKQSTDYDYLTNLNFSRAIFNSGHSLNELFSYPQIVGKDGIHPDYSYSGEIVFLSQDAYYDLGLISESRHWAYESFIGFPYNTRALKTLVKIHFINRQFDAAANCLDILEKGLISDGFIKKYKPYLTDTNLVNNDPELIEKRKNMPTGFEISESLELKLNILLAKDSSNKKALEYLLAFYMLDSQLDKFMSLINYASQYYNQWPINIQEAIVVYGAVRGKKVVKEYGINQNTFERFKYFSLTLRNCGKDSDLAKDMLYDDFKNSYFYFFKFLNPKVTNAKIVVNLDNNSTI